MTSRALVIPFAAPPEGEGLGLGLAALVHTFARLEGGAVGLAQVLPRATEAGDPKEQGRSDAPLEAFVAPDAWRTLIERGDAPADVGIVVTGSFQPPDAGPGHFQLLAFDTKDGSPRARSEAHLDSSTVGRSLVGAIDRVWRAIGGEIGALSDLAELDWEALESVLRAERAALHDPRRGVPHDRFAAMVHLGRAVADAPEARFPAGRLAAVAIDAVMASRFDGDRGAGAALRVLRRACDDAPDRLELLEATAALHVRLGLAAEGEAAALELVGRAPARPGVYGLLAEARRAKGDTAGAEAALSRGFDLDKTHPVLLTERGILLAARGDDEAAKHAWEAALRREPLFAPAFVNLADLAAKRADTVGAEALVDRALAAMAPHPELLRRAIELALLLEPDGVARAARIARLARSLLARVPTDGGAVLVLARALMRQGEREAARRHFAEVERMAPRSPLAAMAHRERFAIEQPIVAMEIDAAMRAAARAEGDELAHVAARARAIADAHDLWTAFHVLGVAELRRGSLKNAEVALEAAAARAPGEPQVCFDLAVTLLAAGRAEDAEAALDRALPLSQKSDGHAALREKIRAAREAPSPRPSFVARLLANVKGW